MITGASAVNEQIRILGINAKRTRVIPRWAYHQRAPHTAESQIAGNLKETMAYLIPGNIKRLTQSVGVSAISQERRGGARPPISKLVTEQVTLVIT